MLFVLSETLRVPDPDGAGGASECIGAEEKEIAQPDGSAGQRSDPGRPIASCRKCQRCRIKHTKPGFERRR